MTKHISILIATALITAASGIAQQTTPKLKSVPIQPTSAVSGQQMYSTYCAACHGADGTGGGPAAPALKAHPKDLSTLSLMNDGVFPANHVATVLKFGSANPAHGSVDMPIWGDLLRTLNPSGQGGRAEAQQRISNLTDYIKQIQR